MLSDAVLFSFKNFFAIRLAMLTSLRWVYVKGYNETCTAVVKLHQTETTICIDAAYDFWFVIGKMSMKYIWTMVELCTAHVSQMVIHSVMDIFFIARNML